MRLPRLPWVSRRRHDMLHGVYTLMEREAEVRTEERDEAREAVEDWRSLWYEARYERDEARARVAELEQAIREHRQRRNASDIRNPYPQDDAKLWSVLDGHDRQERGDVPVTYQDGVRYRLNRRQPESTDVGPPDLPDPPPADPDRDLIGHMEQPNPGPRWRRERGYESSAQPPTGQPPSDPPRGHGSDTTKTSAEVDPPSESGATRHPGGRR